MIVACTGNYVVESSMRIKYDYLHVHVTEIIIFNMLEC